MDQVNRRDDMPEVPDSVNRRSDAPFQDKSRTDSPGTSKAVPNWLGRIRLDNL